MLPVSTLPKLFAIVGSSLLILFLAWRTTRQAGPADPFSFALAIVAAELVSYHAFVHDLSVLYIPILVGIDRLASAQEMVSLTRKTLYVCLLIFFCSPIYMILMLRYAQLQALAFVILIFFFTLLKLTHLPNAAGRPA